MISTIVTNLHRASGATEVESKPEAQGEEAEAVEAAATSVPPSRERPSSAASRDSQGQPIPPDAGQTSPTSEAGQMEARVPTAPHLPSPERTGTTLEGTMSNSALVSWRRGGWVGWEQGGGANGGREKVGEGEGGSGGGGGRTS